MCFVFEEREQCISQRCQEPGHKSEDVEVRLVFDPEKDLSRVASVPGS